MVLFFWTFLINHSQIALWKKLFCKFIFKMRKTNSQVKYFRFSKNASCKQCWLCAKITDVQPEIFQDRGGFVEEGHPDKHFVKNKRKGSQGKILEFLLVDTVKNYISNKKFNSEMGTFRAFFSKLGHFFRFSKRGRGGLLPLFPVWITTLPYTHFKEFSL